MASSKPALWSAATNGKPEEVWRLLAAGVNIDESIHEKSLGGETALHGAVRWGFDAIVEQLVAKGAGVNLVTSDSSRDSALHLAARYGHGAMVALLLDRGAGVNVKNKNRDTALHLAAKFGRGAIVVLLLDQGAGVNVRNNNGESALHLAARGGHSSTVEQLLGRGADVNQTTKHGNTALHFSVRDGHLAITKLLLGEGADMLALNRAGKTPLVALATAIWNPELAAALQAEAARRAALQPGKTSPGPSLSESTESRRRCTRTFFFSNGLVNLTVTSQRDSVVEL